MKSYFISLAIGIFVGAIYGFIRVRSPAPPLIALIGLLGMLAGEQVPLLIKQVLHHGRPTLTWVEERADKPAIDEQPGAHPLYVKSKEWWEKS
jgi:XapX domain-containing protein